MPFSDSLFPFPQWMRYGLIFWLLPVSTMLAQSYGESATADLKLMSVDPEAKTVHLRLGWAPSGKTANTDTLYRRPMNYDATATWTQLGQWLGAEAGKSRLFDDQTGLVAGQAYDYKFERILDPGQKTVSFVSASLGPRSFSHNRGVCILVVTSEMDNELGVEIETWMRDLIGDGWQIEKITIEAAIVGGAPSVKALIKEAHAKQPTVEHALILLGAVPTPFTGMAGPDGHGATAFASDLYYTDMTGTWTDSVMNTTASGGISNLPGDGRYDHNAFPAGGKMAMITGRIDLSRLTVYNALTESALIRRYLAKNHAFRHGLHKPANSWIIRDNFFNYDEGSAMAWRTLPNMFTKLPKRIADLTKTGDELGKMFRQELDVNSYHWAIGMGAGNTDSLAGVANSSDWPRHKPLAVFSQLFGSGMWKWEKSNNMMRAFIAADGWTLTSWWGSRPFVYPHRMILGEPIGASLRLLTDNSYDQTGSQYLYVNVIGDPTLRLTMRDPAREPRALLLHDQVLLKWRAPASVADLSGYYVYRAGREWGRYELISGEAPLTVTRFTDASVSSATAAAGHYMVRAVYRESKNGGYFNGATGLFTSGVDLPPPNYESWLAAADPERTIEAAFPDDDPNGDGYCNEAAHALGLSPLQRPATPPLRIATVAGTATAHLSIPELLPDYNYFLEVSGSLDFTSTNLLQTQDLRTSVWTDGHTAVPILTTNGPVYCRLRLLRHQ